MIAEAPYLRNLAALVLLGTTGAALLDYLFKVHAVEAFGRGDNLLRFFALYYAATSSDHLRPPDLVEPLDARALRPGRRPRARRRSRCSPAASRGCSRRGSAAWWWRAAASRSSAARCSAPATSSSTRRFRPAEKRAAKSIIDVAFDRLGDAVGGGWSALRSCWLRRPQSPTILSLAMACSVRRCLAASRLNRGYIVDAREQPAEPRRRASISDVDAGLDADADAANAAVARRRRCRRARRRQRRGPRVRSSSTREVQDILALRSRDRDRVVAVLRARKGLRRSLVPHVIPLLAWDPVADDAIFALRKVAEERVGEFIDALIDPNQEFAVRRRLARVFSVCVSQRAADGLMLGARRPALRGPLPVRPVAGGDPREEPADRDRRRAHLRRGAARGGVGRPVWESHRLLDGFDVSDSRSSTSSCGTAPARAWRTCSRCCRWCCRASRCGSPFAACTPTIRTCGARRSSTWKACCRRPSATRLWPFLEDRRRRTARGAAARRDPRRSAALAPSIMLNLEELRRRAADPSRSARAADNGWQTHGKILAPAHRDADAAASPATGRPTAGCPTTCSPSRSSASRCLRSVGAGLWTFGLVMDVVVCPDRRRGTAPRTQRRRSTSSGDRRLRRDVRLRAATRRIRRRRKTDVGLVLHGAQRGRRRAAEHLGDAADDRQRLGSSRGSRSSSSSASMIVPTSPRKMLAASLVAASMDPLGVWIAHLRGLPVPSVVNTFILFMPNYVCAVVAIAAVARAAAASAAGCAQAQDMGSYQLVELLGRGGMGEVWRARAPAAGAQRRDQAGAPGAARRAAPRRKRGSCCGGSSAKRRRPPR